MQKKKLFGLVGLAFVVLMTVFAYFLPSDALAESSSHTDVIRVRVYNQYPSVTIVAPENEQVVTTPNISIGANYENSEYVDFTLSYVDENGNTQEIALPRFAPNAEDLDETFGYASGTGTLSISLADYVTSSIVGPSLYNRYVLTARSASGIGFAENSVEFVYAPVNVTQIGTNADNNDPIVTVEHDTDIAKIEIMPVDSKGNNLFDEPIVVEVSEPYDAGSTDITLPFSSYGLSSGDYSLKVTAYIKNAETGDYEAITSPVASFSVSYTQPDAPAIPNTGRLLGNLNISSSDFVITGVVVFAFTLFIAFMILSRKKKDYRKNLRSRR